MVSSQMQIEFFSKAIKINLLCYKLTAASVNDLVEDFHISSTGEAKIVLQFNDTVADSRFQILANSQVRI